MAGLLHFYMEGADRFVYFASKAYQSLTEKINKGFCVLLFLFVSTAETRKPDSGSEN